MKLETVFYDENARLRYDSEQSIDEKHHISLGMSSALRSLVVSSSLLRRY